MFWLVFFFCLAASATAQNLCGDHGSAQSGESNGAPCINPTTQFCRCLCQPLGFWDGYIGGVGGPSGVIGQSGFQIFDNTCGRNTAPGTAGYLARECSAHCTGSARDTLCMSN